MDISRGCRTLSALLYLLPGVVLMLAHSPVSAQLRVAQASASKASAPAAVAAKPAISSSAPLFQRKDDSHKADPAAGSYRSDPVTPSEKPKDLNAPIIGSQNTDFFSANSASTIFQDKVKVNKKPEIQFFNARYVPPKEEELTPETGLRPQDIDPSKKLETPEDVLEAFGNPKEDEKILALDNAPSSFKGMMAAMQIGDEELAFQYARQYARRMRDLKSRSIAGLGLIGTAMEREGLIGKEDWASSEMFSEQRNLLDQDLRQGRQVEEERARVSRLDPKTREFLRKAEEAEEMGSAQPAVQAQLPEAEERRQVRQALGGKIPVDPQGQVQIFFFFRPYDMASRDMVPNIESLYRSIAKEGGMSFLAAPLDQVTAQEVSHFREQTNTTFPIKNASRLVREFGVKQSPTVVFISPSTGKAVFEEGKRSFVYLDEVANIMRGK